MTILKIYLYFSKRRGKDSEITLGGSSKDELLLRFYYFRRSENYCDKLRKNERAKDRVNWNLLLQIGLIVITPSSRSANQRTRTSYNSNKGLKVLL